MKAVARDRADRMRSISAGTGLAVSGALAVAVVVGGVLLRRMRKDMNAVIAFCRSRSSWPPPRGD